MSAKELIFLLAGFASGYEIYRRSTPTGVSELVAAVDAGTLSYTLTGLTANSVGYYHIEAVSGCNVRSTLPVHTRLLRVAMDGDNQLIQPAPAAPYALKLIVGVAGLVTASWQHTDANGEVAVDGFDVYVATGADPFDYATPDFVLGASVRSQSLGTFADGTTVRVVVRAFDESDVEETNTTQASVVADSAAPATPTIVSVL